MPSLCIWTQFLWKATDHSCFRRVRLRFACQKLRNICLKTSDSLIDAQQIPVKNMNKPMTGKSPKAGSFIVGVFQLQVTSPR